MRYHTVNGWRELHTRRNDEWICHSREQQLRLKTAHFRFLFLSLPLTQRRALYRGFVRAQQSPHSNHPTKCEPTHFALHFVPSQVDGCRVKSSSSTLRLYNLFSMALHLSKLLFLFQSRLELAVYESTAIIPSTEECEMTRDRFTHLFLKPLSVYRAKLIIKYLLISQHHSIHLSPFTANVTSI